MAITVPTAFKFQQGNLDVTAGEQITETPVGVIRANAHFNYAAVGLRPFVAQYFDPPLETSSTSDQIVLSVPITFAPDRRARGIVVYFERTNTVRVHFRLRNRANTTTLSSFGPSTAGAGVTYATLTDPGVDEVLFVVIIRIFSGTGGIQWIRVCEAPMVAADLP